MRLSRFVHLDRPIENITACESAQSNGLYYLSGNSLILVCQKHGNGPFFREKGAQINGIPRSKDGHTKHRQH